MLRFLEKIFLYHQAMRHEIWLSKLSICHNLCFSYF